MHTSKPVQVHNDKNLNTPDTVPYGDSEDSEDSEDLEESEESEDSEDLEESEDSEESEESDEDKSSTATTVPYGEEEEEAYTQEQGPTANQDFMEWFTQNRVSPGPTTPGPVQETRAARRARRPGVTPPTAKR
jgi:hypothetical protein